MDDYTAYLPHINAVEGIKRIMGNKKLFITMLGRFKLRQMTDAIAAAIATGDYEKMAFAAHALKGTAGNLGFPTLYAHTSNMEQLAKDGNEIASLMPALEELVETLLPLMEQLIAQES